MTDVVKYGPFALIAGGSEREVQAVVTDSAISARF